MTLGRSVTLSWKEPEDDGGCKIGTYIVEYYRVRDRRDFPLARTVENLTFVSDWLGGVAQSDDEQTHNRDVN